MTSRPLLWHKVGAVYENNWKDWTAACFKESWQHVQEKTEENQEKSVTLAGHRPEVGFTQQNNRDNGDEWFMVSCRLYRVKNVKSTPTPAESVHANSVYI